MKKACTFVGVAVLLCFFVAITNVCTGEVGFWSIGASSSQKFHGEKYLLFYNSGGFSNQLIGLYRAAILAKKTNRTIVLPPVLPHFPKESRPYSGGACKAQPGELLQLSKDIFTAILAEGQQVRKSNRLEIPSFQEIINFTLITRATGARFMDLKDFMSREVAANISMGKIHDDYFYCTKHPIERFEADFDNNQEPVAAIISAFYMEGLPRNILPERPFLAFVPSDSLLALIGDFYFHLPEKYVGVHMRFNDKWQKSGDPMDCSDEIIQKAFNNVCQSLRLQNVSYDTTIFLGYSDKKIKDCFLQNSGDYRNVITIRDIIAQDGGVQSKLQDFAVGEATILILMDQVLISLGENIAIDSTAFGVSFASTFQHLIKVRQKSRKSFVKGLLTEEWMDYLTSYK